MCFSSAAAIRSSFCVVLNTQRFFASSGSTTADVPTVAIIGTFASAMTSRIANALGVVDGPISASTLFSAISFLAFCTARVVSPPSSSEMYSTVAPPIAARQDVARVLLRNADRGRRTGRRHHQPDADLGRRPGRSTSRAGLRRMRFGRTRFLTPCGRWPKQVASRRDARRRVVERVSHKRRTSCVADSISSCRTFRARER